MIPKQLLPTSYDHTELKYKDVFLMWIFITFYLLLLIIYFRFSIMYNIYQFHFLIINLVCICIRLLYYIIRHGAVSGQCTIILLYNLV